VKGTSGMSKKEIIEQLKNIKDQYLNDSKGDIDADDIIEAITDVIHDVEGNDGLDFTMEYDDEYEESFESVDFTQLEV
jgi:O-phosphoseryl-tRNA(Cys) synthetase